MWDGRPEKRNRERSDSFVEEEDESVKAEAELVEGKEDDDLL